MKYFSSLIIIEDHSKIGGLSNIVKSFAYECNYNGKILSYSLKDEFIHCYGSQEDLLNLHGINNLTIYRDIINKGKERV